MNEYESLLEFVGATRRGRVYKRRFDHDEALARYLAGEKVAALSREYGVSHHAVDRVVNPKALETERRAQAKLREKLICETCGGRAWGTQRTDDGRRLCHKCRAKERRTRFTEIGGVLHAKCFGGCGETKPIDDFPGDNRYRDIRPNGVSGECRACQTVSRRRRRDANPEAQRAYDRAYKRRRRAAA